MFARTWLLAGVASVVVGIGSFAFGGDISGTAKLDGPVPDPVPIDMSGTDCGKMHADPVMEETIVATDKGMLANVVVSVKKEDSPNLKGDAPKEAAMLDQVGCMYKPHVIAMMGGQDLVVKNSDNFLHNVHTLSEDNPSINKAQTGKNDGEKMADPPTVAEYIHVTCNVHPWMNAWIAVFEHPFFGVSDTDGKWTIKNLPDGNYTLVAWQEKLGTQEKKITVKDGKATEAIEFLFKQDSATGPDVRNVILASDSGSKKVSCPACANGKSDHVTTAAK